MRASPSEHGLVRQLVVHQRHLAQREPVLHLQKLVQAIVVVHPQLHLSSVDVDRDDPVCLNAVLHFLSVMPERAHRRPDQRLHLPLQELLKVRWHPQLQNFTLVHAVGAVADCALHNPRHMRRQRRIVDREGNVASSVIL